MTKSLRSVVSMEISPWRRSVKFTTRFGFLKRTISAVTVALFFDGSFDTYALPLSMSFSIAATCAALSCDWWCISSASMPSHVRFSRMSSSNSGLSRVGSVSSIRTMNLPPWCRASRKLKSAVRAVPTCILPVGEGAIRVTNIVILDTLVFKCGFNDDLRYLSRGLRPREWLGRRRHGCAQIWVVHFPIDLRDEEVRRQVLLF